MCHHLGRVHLSPLPQGCGLELVDACHYLVNGFLLKQVPHFLPPQLTPDLDVAEPQDIFRSPSISHAPEIPRFAVKFVAFGENDPLALGFSITRFL
jgi:hypothetical protein